MVGEPLPMSLGIEAIAATLPMEPQRRVLVLEQLYRGFKILRGEPYHRD